jgi:dihydroorotase-like cyclic amidohydrolase
MVDLVIKNGRIITPGGIIYGGIGIKDGTIVYVGSNYGLPQSKRVLDAREDFVIPGLIDPHVHLAGGAWPSQEEGLRAQFKAETDGALHGGVTSLGHFVVTPIGTSLVPLLETTISIGEELSHIDFFCHVIIMDEGHIDEEPELFRRGVTSFKHMFNAYRGAEGMGKLGPCDEGMLFRSFEFIAKQGYPALGMCHCEEMDIVFVLMERLRQAGRNDLLAWTEARPNFVEHMRIAHALNIARSARCPLYIAHISTTEGAELVAEERRRGYPIWGETCPHYLTHTGDMEAEIGCWGKVNPSLKYPKDNDALWLQIRNGGITSIATDHGTNTREYKEQGGGKHNNIWNSRPIICGGMEHMLPVMMTHGVNAGRISMEDLVRVSSSSTARVFGLYPRKGCLSPGSDADIVIVDPAKEAVINQDFYHCQVEFGIYSGWKVKGMARTTIVRGEVVLEDYVTVGKPGHGKYLFRRAY